MTPVLPVKISAALDLVELNKLVIQQEKIYGPLADIDYDNSPRTILNIAITGTRPTLHAVIDLQKEGVPVVPAGSDLVCQGLIFVKGELKLAAATRPKAGTP